MMWKIAVPIGLKVTTYHSQNTLRYHFKEKHINCA